MAVIKVFDRGAAVGDILYLDSSTNKKKLFARPSEVSSLPTSGTYTQVMNGVSITYTAPFTPVGVVFHVDGRKVYVINKTSGGSLQYKTSNTADGEASNGRTPTANEAIVQNGNVAPVNRSSFETSSYCKLLRSTYASYESYISENCGVKFPQSAGCFSLPDGKTITYEYNDANHPGFQHCAGVDYGEDGVSAGDWYMPGVYEGTALMRDAVLSKVNASMRLINGAEISNGTTRWFAQRYNATYAWNFLGSYGLLYDDPCTHALAVQAVVLLEV